MTIEQDITLTFVKQKIWLSCDSCKEKFQRRLSSVKASRKKRGTREDFCISCAACLAARKRPQNKKEYWQNPERKKKHSKSIKSSVAHHEAIKNRPSIVGEKNPMWGKAHSEETKRKMSQSRTGKTGHKATAWKGGKNSLNKRIKGALQRKYKWFHRVIDRDGNCQHCNATTQLDAHHIRPLAPIIKELLTSKNFTTEFEKIDWLILQPKIANHNLTNGLTLCRKCHKNVHKNWGSHEPKVR